MDNIIPMIVDYGVKIIGVLVALWVAFKIANWVQTQVTTRLQARKFDATLSIFFGNLAKWALLVSAILGILGMVGIQTTSFAAIIGAAGLAVGLAFQGTLSNFSAGILLLVFRPFNVGDLVKAGGVVGVVAEIGLFTVSFDAANKNRHIVPNSAVIGGAIEVFTYNNLRRVDIDVGCDYSADIDATRAILEEAISKVEDAAPGAAHQVFLSSLGASSVDWQVRIWCTHEKYWDVYQQTIRATKMALDAANIGIPYPQMDVHLDKVA